MTALIMAGPKAPLKRLKDFPLKVWQPAADTCEYCGAQYEARVTYVDKTGDFGTVEFRAKHKPDCMHDLGDQSETDVAGWKFAEYTVYHWGKEWTPILARADVCPCLNCGRLVVGIPFIHFLQDGAACSELDFCFSCAEDLGILAQLLKRGAP